MLARSSRVRDAGALAALPWHLAGLGLVRGWMGDFAGAASLVAESEAGLQLARR
jgi:hypothetical protein